MTRTLEMCVEASLAQQTRHGWECQTPLRSVSIHTHFQSSTFGIFRERKNGKKEWESVFKCVYLRVSEGGVRVSEGFRNKPKRGCHGQ